MKKNSVTYYPVLLLTAFCFLALQGFPQKKISLVFHNKAGTEDLILGNSYTNILGEKITVQKFKYYVSNVSVTDKLGKTTLLPATYFLVDEADPSSKTITVTVPDNAIQSIGFLLGVDSIRNVSGIQTDALDPLKGMFWTWNSGYIMAKLEGSSESSRIAGQSFTYHIGGFKGEMNTLKNISLPVSSKQPVSELHISADINAWFKGKYEIRTAETPVCHTPGDLAMKIADNYSAMFTLNSVR